MTPLRRKTIEAMTQRGFADSTHRCYLAVIGALAQYTHRSPDTLEGADVRRYLEHLVRERQLSASTCHQHASALRFLFSVVLGRELDEATLVVPKLPQRIPELLSAAEVRRLVEATDNPKHRALLCTCYGCGLRVSELVRIRLRHVDGERRQLRVEQGKGSKDRHVALSAATLEMLRAYWRECRPVDWLFPGREGSGGLHISSVQRVYGACKQAAGIEKVGGIHALRHAYATHQLEAGLPVHVLQRYLGHRDIATTMRYVHWTADGEETDGSRPDVMAELGLGR